MQDERFIFCEIFHLSSLGTPGSPSVPWVPGSLFVLPPSQAKPHCSQVASVEKQKANCGCSQTFQPRIAVSLGSSALPALGRPYALAKVQYLETYRAVNKGKSRFNLDIIRVRSGEPFVLKKKKQAKEIKHNCRQKKAHTGTYYSYCLHLKRQRPDPHESSKSFGKVRPSQ